MSLGDEYPRILRAYLDLARRFSGDAKRVLKTDAFNEARGLPMPGGIALNIRGDVFAVEADRSTYEQALALGVQARHGDIRSLPFPDARFDVVLDFSTIDHVVEYATVLAEYSRVLVCGGTLVVVFWAKPSLEVVNTQVYLPFDEFVGQFQSRFHEDERAIVYEEPDRALWLLIGRRR